MKIFVTGGTGKVGSRLIPYLIKQGHTVRALVRDLERAKFLREQGAELICGDLLKTDLSDSLRGMDAIIHAAAQFRGGISEEEAFINNVDATKRLADMAIETGVARFIYVSTGLVYSNNIHNRPWREEDEITPAKNLYPKTKIAAEKILIKLYEEHKLDLRILRLAFVYGDHDKHLEEFAPIMEKWSPALKMSLVHHKDVTQALLLGVTAPKTHDYIFNVVDDQPLEIKEILSQINSDYVLDESKEFVSFPEWEMVLDNEKIKNKLNFIPIYPSFYDAKKQGEL